MSAGWFRADDVRLADLVEVVDRGVDVPAGKIEAGQIDIAARQHPPRGRLHLTCELPVQPEGDAARPVRLRPPSG